MPIWDGGDISQPFWEREALQLAWQQQEEPDEIDLAPGTEAPPGTTVPHEKSMRAIIDSRNAARKLWDLIQNSLRGARRMIALRLALTLLGGLLLPTAAVAQSVLRVDPLEQRSTDRAHYQAETRCGFKHPYAEQLRELTAEQQAENAVHEAVHLRQLAGNCDSVMAVWDRDLLARVRAEAEASCDGWRVGNIPPALWHARSVRAAAWWARFTTVGYEAAIAAYDEACAR